jgi:hypothetical protein
MEFYMKAFASVLMISASLIAGAAQAATSADAPVSKTRAQVVAELQQARAEGLLSTGEADYPAVVQANAGAKTRAQVESELVVAEAAGQVSTGESDYPPLAAQTNASSTTRAAVEAEYAQLAAAGQLPQTTF